MNIKNTNIFSKILINCIPLSFKRFISKNLDTSNTYQPILKLDQLKKK
jgi:hypothetical protein